MASRCFWVTFKVLTMFPNRFCPRDKTRLLSPTFSPPWPPAPHLSRALRRRPRVPKLSRLAGGAARGPDHGRRPGRAGRQGKRRAYVPLASHFLFLAVPAASIKPSFVAFCLSSILTLTLCEPMQRRTRSRRPCSSSCCRRIRCDWPGNAICRALSLQGRCF